MADKPLTDWFDLPHRVLSLHGRDALEFAHAQFMSDVAALDELHWQWSGWLTPKGRVVALFALLKLGPERLWLLLPDADPGLLAEQLRRFVFRSRLEIAAPALRVRGSFLRPQRALGARCDGLPMDDMVRVELDMGTPSAPRTMLLSGLDPATPDSITAGVDQSHAAQAWARFDLAHGLPRLSPDQSGQWTPQMLSLDRLNAFSVSKGCYPGQEIVARTHFLGKAKRGLARLRGAGVGQLDEVMQGDVSGPGVSMVKPIGQVICAAEEEGLAVLPTPLPDSALSTGGHACEVVPLLDGLAR